MAVPTPPLPDPRANSGWIFRQDRTNFSRGDTDEFATSLPTLHTFFMLTLTRICVGSLRGKWEHLIRHVKARDTARTIRGNLTLDARKRKKSNEAGESLRHDVDDTRKHLQSCRQKRDSVEAQFDHMYKEACALTHNVRAMAKEIMELHRRAKLLDCFNSKCLTDTRKMRSLHEQLFQMRCGRFFRAGREEAEKRLISDGKSGRVVSGCEVSLVSPGKKLTRMFSSVWFAPIFYMKPMRKATGSYVCADNASSSLVCHHGKHRSGP